MLKRSALILAIITVPAAAQSGPTADVRGVWADVRDYITQAAVDVPESMYAYRPTPDVRTFGELIGHVAGSQRMFCAIALGEPVPAEDAVEKAAKTKASLVQAMRASNTYCARAYEQSDAAVAATVTLFGAKRTRLFTLIENASHNGEHYGNIVTYMRLNKMVPPSSRPPSK
jgi:uncharacterized damage-inducible protein DinB